MKIAEYLRKTGKLYTHNEYKKDLRNTLLAASIPSGVSLMGLILAMIGSKCHFEILAWCGILFCIIGVLVVLSIYPILLLRYGYRMRVYNQYKRHKNEWEEKEMPENVQNIDYIIFGDKKDF